MSSSNRIPASSVSFSNKSYVMDMDKFQLPFLENETQTLSQFEKTKRIQDIEEKEKQLSEREAELDNVVVELNNRYQMLQETQKNFEEQMNQELMLHERKKLEDYYAMREFMWEHAISMAEHIVNQNVNQQNIIMSDMFIGLLKKLPIQLNELRVSAHPDTIEYIAKDTKEDWLLKDIEWKKDYSMELGDFIIEDEYEIFDCTVKTILDEIKNQINKKNKEIRGAVDEMAD